MKLKPQNPNYLYIILDFDPFITIKKTEFSGNAKFDRSYSYSDYTRVYISMEFDLNSYQPEGLITIKAVASLFKKEADREYTKPLDVIDYSLIYKNPKEVTVKGSYFVMWDVTGSYASGGILFHTDSIPLSYTFPVTSISLHNVKITDSIPAQTIFLKATQNGQLDIPSQMVVWNLGDMTLSPGEGKKLHCLVQVPRYLNEPSFGWRTGIEEVDGENGEKQTRVIGYIDNSATFKSSELEFKAKSTVKVILCGLAIKKTGDEKQSASKKNQLYNHILEYWNL